MSNHQVRRAALAVTALVLGLTRAGLGQFTPPPPNPPDVNRLIHEMAARVRDLGEDIASDLGTTPQGPHLIEDTRELAEAVDQAHEALHNQPDPATVQRAYAGIDQTWHHLAVQLAQPGIATPSVSEAAMRVAALDVQIHRVLGLVPPGGGPPRAVPANLGALVHELARRVRHLREDIAIDLQTTPQGRHLIEDTDELARAVAQFHEALDNGGDYNLLLQSYAGIDQAWHHLQEQFARPGIATPAVGRAAAHVAELDAQIHQALGFEVGAPIVIVVQGPGPGPGPVPPPIQPVPVPPPTPRPYVVMRPAAPVGPPPVLGLADRLVAETDAFLQVFGPTARIVPQGGQFLADAEALRAAAADFRATIAQAGDPARLAGDFEALQGLWGRMQARVDMIARGRTGPNIQQIEKIGAIIGEMRRQLAGPVPGPGGPFGP